MFALRFTVLCTGILAASLASVNGLTDKEKGEIKTLLVPFVKECGKEFGVTEDDIKAAKEDGTIKDLDPCLISCVMKKIGIINDKGVFDEKKATELSTEFLSDAEEQSKALEIINTCASVNAEAVGDGDKGCERAKLLMDCYLPLKANLPGTP